MDVSAELWLSNHPVWVPESQIDLPLSPSKMLPWGLIHWVGGGSFLKGWQRSLRAEPREVMGMERGDEIFFKAFVAFPSILEDPLLSAATEPIVPTGTWKRPRKSDPSWKTLLDHTSNGLMFWDQCVSRGEASGLLCPSDLTPGMWCE